MSRLIVRAPKAGLGEETIYSLANTGLIDPRILPFPDDKDLLIIARKTLGIGPKPEIRKVNVSSHMAGDLGELPENTDGFVWGEPGRTQTADLVVENATQPVISPDGRRVAYITLVGSSRERNELWVSGIDGSNRVKLAASEELSTGDWSADGSQLTFEDDSGGVGKVYAVDADGSDLRQIQLTGPYMQNAIWGADGKSLYFSGMPKGAAKSTIWKANLDGSNVETVVEGCGFVVSDASPDGQYLLVTSFGEKQGIYEYSIANRKCSVIVPGISTLEAKFLRDGKSLLYTVASRGETIIYRQPWKNGKLDGPAQAAVKLPFVFPQSYWGNAYDFSRDLSTIVYARPSGQADLYLLTQK